jgi:hypothetical protein
MIDLDDALLERVRESYRAGLGRPVRRGRNLEQVYDTLQVLAMADRLPVKEITTLGKATDPRERGLKAARNGQLEEGAGLIAESRRIYGSARLSREAADYAETFQTAAESYIEYRSGDYAAADASMMRSLQLCEDLANAFGDSFEMRRVHLARNVARIRAFAGDRNQGLRISAKLLQYIGSRESAWPLPYSGPPRRRLLPDDAAMFMLDQVLAEALRLLEPDAPAAIANLPAVAEARDLLLFGAPAFQRAAHCLSACIGYVERDTRVFLEESSDFFETGAQSLELVWREMEKKFLPADRAVGSQTMGTLAEIGFAK